MIAKNHAKSLPQRSTKKKAFETIPVPEGTKTVSCDGGHERLGHPKVWYDFSSKNFAVCHYCSRIFVKSS